MEPLSAIGGKMRYPTIRLSTRKIWAQNKKLIKNGVKNGKEYPQLQLALAIAVVKYGFAVKTLVSLNGQRQWLLFWWNYHLCLSFNNSSNKHFKSNKHLQTSRREERSSSSGKFACSALIKTSSPIFLWREQLLQTLINVGKYGNP